MTYNLTAFDNITSPYDVFAGVNDNLTGGLGGIIILISFIIGFVIFSKRTPDIKKALLGSSALSLIVAVLVWASGLSPSSYIIYPLAIVIISIGLLMFKT